jgi:hypothetical protein
MDVTCNPHGVLYNPESIATALTALLDGRRYDACTDVASGILRFHEPTGRYYSFHHHGSLSAESSEELVALLNSIALEAGEALKRCRHLLVTLGTAWVYTLADRPECVVANCHQFPAAVFSRRRLTVDEIVGRWVTLLDRLPATMHIVLTVSPIRYLKETLHGSQLSKSILLLAADELVRRYPGRVEYLPAYEMLTDDLRDYRFYADDLVHPSAVAIELVRQYVADNFLDPSCRDYLREVAPLVKALQHRPFHPESAAYQAFIAQNKLKIDRLIEKYHIFTLAAMKQRFEDKNHL